MPYFRSRNIAGRSVGFSVSSFRDVDADVFPPNIIMPLRTVPFDFIHTLYVLCLEEPCEGLSGAFHWVYYVLDSIEIPEEYLDRGSISFMELLSLRPQSCGYSDLESEIYKKLTA